MLKVVEYLIDPRRNWAVLGIPDGWRPLHIRESHNTISWPNPMSWIVLAALVDDEASLDQEVFRIVRPGQDLKERSEGLESAYLGFACERYVFLDLPEERPERRLAHPALIEAQERAKQVARETPEIGVDSPD